MKEKTEMRSESDEPAVPSGFGRMTRSQLRLTVAKIDGRPLILDLHSVAAAAECQTYL